MAGDVFESLPASPRIHAVPHLGVAGDRANFGIHEMWHQSRDRIARDDRVSIDAHKKFGILNLLDPKVESRRLASIWLGKDHNPSRRFLRTERFTGYFEGAVLGAVIDHDHAQVGVV